MPYFHVMQEWNRTKTYLDNLASGFLILILNEKLRNILRVKNAMLFHRDMPKAKMMLLNKPANI